MTALKALLESAGKDIVAELVESKDGRELRRESTAGGGK